MRRIPRIDDREISVAWKTIYERDGAGVGEDTLRQVFEDFLVGRGIFEYERSASLAIQGRKDD